MMVPVLLTCMGKNKRSSRSVAVWFRYFGHSAVCSEYSICGLCLSGGTPQ